jgi:hypothetical protein
VATVNPIFTWVRLAQRIPVRIHIDEVPPGVVLSAGMTATVEIDGPTVTSLSVLTLACVEADRDPTRRPRQRPGESGSHRTAWWAWEDSNLTLLNR